MNQALLLQKDRQIMELQKQLGAERKISQSLRSDMQSLQKYHLEELEKAEKQHALKQHQLRDMLGDKKIQLTAQSE